jgi:hypothetical protein
MKWMALVRFGDDGLLWGTGSTAGADTLRQAGYSVNRLPQDLHTLLRLEPEDDFLEAICETPPIAEPATISAIIRRRINDLVAPHDGECSDLIEIAPIADDHEAFSYLLTTLPKAEYNDDDEQDIEMGRTETKLKRLVVLVERHPYWGVENNPDEDWTEWLLAAADAERAWRSLDPDYMIKHNPDGSESPSGFPYYPNFLQTAIEFAERGLSFAIELHTAFSRKGGSLLISDFVISDFVLLANAGFFKLGADGVYRFTTPKPPPTAKSIKLAYQKYWWTEDGDYILHPELCISALPRTKALARLEEMLAAETAQGESATGAPLRRDP